MKTRKLPIFLSLIFLLSLSACGGDTKSSITSSSSAISSSKPEPSSVEPASSSEPSKSSEIPSSSKEPQIEWDLEKVIEKEGYKSAIRENDAVSGSLPVSVTSNKEEALRVYLDGKPIEEWKDKSQVIKATLQYELDPEHPCSTDGVEHPNNTVEINGSYIDLLHNEEGRTVEFKSSKLKDGENKLTITIGYVYMNQKFNKKAVRYKLGWGDDFRIRNVQIALANGEVIIPDSMLGYYCDEAVKKYVTQQMDVDPTSYYWLGDGWGDGEYLAHINHKDPAYERPFAIDYSFDFEAPVSNVNYTINTTEVLDGKHTISAVAGNEVVYQKHVIFDNTAPEIECNLSDGDMITPDFLFNHKALDGTSGVQSCVIKVDGKSVSKVDLSGLSYGPHSITIITSDKAKNKKADTICFNVVKESYLVKCAYGESGKMKFSSPYATTFEIEEYQNNILTINTVDDENFIINLNDPLKNVLIDYSSEINNGEKIKIEALNVTSQEYEQVFLSNNGDAKFELDPKGYVDDNNDIKLRATINKVDNGSNKMIWTSDIQYLAKNESNYQDISHYYDTLMQYIADEYEDGNVSYVINTGDTVDDTPDYGTACDKEWQHASAAWSKLDEVGMPYGQEAGNHCVGNSGIIDYSYFSKYFGTSRTGNTNYYGQSLNNNQCHYDLITVGGFDFVVLYLGYGVEATMETIEWATKVLETYSHRNAIIATHCYLTEKMIYDSTGKANEIYENLVVPYENVKMVLCGHTDQSDFVTKQIGNRTVYELISCFQFVETLTDHLPVSETKHVTNGYKCNGEGWIKDIEILEDGTLNFHTYSPVIENDEFSTTTGAYNKPDFSINIDLIKNEDKPSNVHINAYQVGSIINTDSTGGSYTRKNTESIILVTDECGAKGFFL